MSSRTPSRGRARSENAPRPQVGRASGRGAERSARARTSSSQDRRPAATATLERTSDVGVRTRATTSAPAGPRRAGGSSVRGRRIPQSAPSSAGMGSRLGSVWLSARRVPFVVVVLVIIAAGIGFTLFLSAKSTEDTYSLRAEQDHNSELREQRDSLLTEIEDDSSAESLAQKAKDQGMVSVLEAPMIVRNPDGSVSTSGPEEAALGAPIEPLQAKSSDSGAGDRSATGDSNRFGLPGQRTGSADGGEGAQGGLSVPHEASPQLVPDLGAGRRVDGLSAPAAAAPAPAAPAAAAPAPAAPAAEAPAPVPADSPR